MVLQDLTTFFRGILALQKVLEGFGVGRADVATSVEALRWIARDGVGHFGLLLFTSLCSTNFGSNVKRWRLFADLTCDVAITLEMLAPLSKGLFLPLVCLASLGKAICGVAAGAANGAVDLHFSGGGTADISEIMAKNGAQETAVKLLGLGLSVSFSRLANRSARTVWLTFLGLTALHVFANYRALRCLKLRTLNAARLDILIPAFLHGAGADGAMDLAAVAAREPILGLRGRRPAARSALRGIAFGARPSEALRAAAPHAAAVIAQATAGEEPFALVPSGRGFRRVRVVVFERAGELSADDRLRAVLQCHAYDRRRAAAPPATAEDALALARSAAADARERHGELRAALEARGWDTSKVLLEDAGWRMAPLAPRADGGEGEGQRAA